MSASNLYLPQLVADDPDAARAQQSGSLDGWSQQGFQVQHYWDWFARGEIDLYGGDARAAWERLHSRWGDFRRSLLPRAQAVYLEAIFLRARVAVALAARSTHPEAVRLLRHAERDVRRLRGESMPWGDAMAELAAAAVAAARRDREAARRHAAAAVDGFRTVEMEQFAAAARWRLGQLTAGDDGKRLVAEARSWLESQGTRDPARMVGMLAPGAWDD